MKTIENLLLTHGIVHAGFRGFRAVSPASILGGKLTGLKHAIPYDTIHSTLWWHLGEILLNNKLIDFLRFNIYCKSKLYLDVKSKIKYTYLLYIYNMHCYPVTSVKSQLLQKHSGDCC